ncbi:MAG: Rpn family recombination-promoting nuclease/putative transposase [Oscillospiraceae bacterium]
MTDQIDEFDLYDDRKEKEEAIKNFRLIDDTFMTKVFEDKKCSELLLRIILGRDDLIVKEAVTQYEIKNLQGRSVRLDIFAVDSNGEQYDIEVQRSDNGAAPKRGRYISSLMDANTLDVGEAFQNLPKSYVIFITEKDYFKGGLPVYRVSRFIENLNYRIYDDESSIIYVNGENRDDTALGKLMQDFFCKDPHQMNYELLAERAEYFKENKEGVSTMCQIMEDYGDKREQRANERAKKESIEKSIRFANKLWDNGMRDLEKISVMSELPLDEVKKLFEDRTA